VFALRAVEYVVADQSLASCSDQIQRDVDSPTVIGGTRLSAGGAA